MVSNMHCVCPACNVRVISKEEDPRIRKLWREEVAQPKLLFNHPGRFGMAVPILWVQAMHGDNAIFCYSLNTAAGRLCRTQRSDPCRGSMFSGSLAESVRKILSLVYLRSLCGAL